MAIIHLTTIIQAPIELCFDLARDVDAHQKSTSGTMEKAIGGRTSGLCEAGDEVTWEAVHLGVRQKLSVRILKMSRPEFFQDEMIKGAFSYMRHKHHFKTVSTGTEMMDEFEYGVPLGVLGKLFDKIFLKGYMKRFLKIRNLELKSMAENRSQPPQ